MSWEPLNETLYRGLERAFGSVEVIRHGQAFVSKPGQFRGETSAKVVSWGESYRVCCPICQESDHKLFVSHAFGTVDDSTEEKILLAHCFKHQKSVVSLIYRALRFWSIKIPFMVPYCGEVVVPDDSVVSPGLCVRLDERCPEVAPAGKYLEDRGMDPEWAAHMYGLSYCVQGNPDVYGGLMEGRLIIPAFKNGGLVGWQGRLLHNPPKLRGLKYLRYLSMPGQTWRSHTLLGADQAVAASTNFVVVVEGPLDMVRQGPPCVATMGLSVSYPQMELMAELWGGQDKTVFVAGDSGEQAVTKTREVAGVIRSMVKGRVISAPLPHGDPGDWRREDFFKFLSDLARSGGGETSGSAATVLGLARA